MRNATAFITTKVTQEINYVIKGDFPDGFAMWSNEDKYAWLDENAHDQFTEYYESGSIESIDKVFLDE